MAEPKPSPKLSPYRQIDPNRIIETAKLLHSRISERFPDRGLVNVALEVVKVAETSAAKVEWVAQPARFLRIGLVLLTGFLLLFGLGIIATIAGRIHVNVPDLGALLQMIEAGINDVILVSAALYFLWSVETRWKRSKALADLSELRAIAHIIDLHQLTKDPERALLKERLIGFDTSSSPKRELNEFELSRYLDYCSEMLSILSKIAVLYPQRIDDSVVLSAVDEIEALTAGLSRKIWQKIMILNMRPPVPGRPDPISKAIG